MQAGAYPNTRTKAFPFFSLDVNTQVILVLNIGKRGNKATLSDAEHLLPVDKAIHFLLLLPLFHSAYWRVLKTFANSMDLHQYPKEFLALNRWYIK